MKDRIIQLLKNENLSATKFADIIGVQRSSISHILSGRNKPSFDFIEKTLNKFPDINPEWLIMGTGNIYKVNSKYENKIEIKEGNNEKQKDKGQFINNEKEQQESLSFSDVTYVNNVKVERIVIFYEDRSFIEYKPK